MFPEKSVVYQLVLILHPLPKISGNVWRHFLFSLLGGREERGEVVLLTSSE